MGIATFTTVAVLAGCGGRDEPSTPTGAGERVLDRIEILGGPDWLAADDEFLYVKLDRGSVERIDPSSMEVVGSTEIGGDLCQGIGVGFGSVWSCRGTDIVRIDPVADRVVATVPVNKAFDQGTLAGGFGRIWVLVGDGSQLVGIDPATNLADPPIDLGVRGLDLATDDTSVWVVSAQAGQVLRVDPAERVVAGRVDGLDEPRTLDTADGIWVGLSGSTVRIDPTTLAVLATVPVSTGPFGSLAGRNGELWIRGSSEFLIRVDTAEATVVEKLSEDVRSGGDVMIAFDALWTTAYDDAALFRLPLS